MTTIEIEKECGCFRKSGLSLSQTFDTKSQALNVAQSMVDEMNEIFCQKHLFSIVEEEHKLIIKVDLQA